MGRSVSEEQLYEHRTRGDLWVAVNSEVYNMTAFAPQHPGGSEIIERYAGGDASEEYNSFHPPGLIAKELAKEDHIGTLNLSSRSDTKSTKSDLTPVENMSERPPLSSMLSLNDFETMADMSLRKKNFVFISGASNDNRTRDANRNYWQHIWFRPRIMRDVSRPDTTCFMMDKEVPIPVCIAPAGLATAGGPEGEIALSKGASKAGIIQIISSSAVYPISEIVSEAPMGYPFGFQLYVNKNRSKTEETLASLPDNIKAIFVTADLPVLSKREDYERANGSAVMSSNENAQVAQISTAAHIDPALCWNDVAWLRKCTKLPLYLKGVQNSADARIALESGFDGIVISNHGGRALDDAPPSVLVLLELRRDCPEIFDSIEVIVDGGLRRGSDVLKAVCLGAKAVGIGRTFLYALGYGEAGVSRVVQIMQDELRTAMRLCGMRSLSEASPDFLNTTRLEHLLPKRLGVDSQDCLRIMPSKL